MPKLPGYTAPLQGAVTISGGRRAGGEDFGAGLGVALTQAGRTLGVAAEEQLVALEQQDQRRMLVGHAELRAKYAKSLQDAELSGDALDPIRKQFEDEATALRDQTSTVAGAGAADVHTQNSLAVFDSRASQITIERAGAEARTGGSKLLSSNAALLLTNPAYLPVAIAEAESFADTYAGRLKPAQIAEMKRGLREHLTVSAVSGEIATGDPKSAQDKIVAGQWTDLSPEARTMLLGRAESEIRARRSEGEQRERFEAWKRDNDSRVARDEYLKQVLTGGFKHTEALHDTRLSTEHREHLFVFNEAWWRQKTGTEKQSNPSVVRDLTLRIYAREGDDKRIFNDDPIYKALADGQLNTTDFNRLRVAVAELRDPNNSPVGRTFGRALGVMQRLYSGPIWVGREHIASNIINTWAWDVQEKMEALRRDNKNPADLFNPASKDYVLNRDYLARFVREASDGSTAAGVPAVGTELDFQDGTTRSFQGGDPAKVESWKVVKNKTPNELILPKSGLKVRWTGQGDKNDLANWEPTEAFKTSGGDINPATVNYQNWRKEAAKERADFFNSLMGN